MAVNLGLDFGVANVEICQKDKGILLREPNVAAVDPRGNVVSVGTEALMLFGRSPGALTLRRPFERGALTDFNLVAEILDRFLESAAPKVKKHMLIAAKFAFGADNKELLTRALRDCRCGSIEFYDSSAAALTDLGLYTSDDGEGSYSGTVICDIGAGSIEAAYVRRGELFRAETKFGAGDLADDTMISYIKTKYGLTITKAVAMEAKHKLSLYESDRAEATLFGVDGATGMPRRITVSTMELLRCCTPQIDDAAEVITSLLSNLPRHGENQSSADSIVLIGGGAMMPGIAEYISAMIGREVTLASSPCDTAISGLCSVLEAR